MSNAAQESSASSLQARVVTLERLIEQLDCASSFAKLSYQGRVLDVARRILLHPDGIEVLRAHIARLDEAGIFEGTDWAKPSTLLPGLVGSTLSASDTQTIVLECLSLLRLLEVAEDRHRIQGIPPEYARHFLTQVLALNLDRVLGSAHEADRVGSDGLAPAVDRIFAHLMERIGAEDILERLIEEVWRILSQRPLQVDHIKSMIVQIAIASQQGTGDHAWGADRLISALFGPTHLCRDDPGLEAYLEQLEAASAETVRQEAGGMARAMHDTGLVSDYHAVLLRWLSQSSHAHLLGEALGLSSTGLDCMRCYQSLIDRLIEEAVQPGTAQSVLGIAMMLERGILYSPPIAPSLWRLLETRLSGTTCSLLQLAYGDMIAPKPRLVAGAVMLLGQPLGIGQGNNPTCQAARALSMWALNDPDYLLWLLTQVICGDRLTLYFEGQPLDSALLPAGLAAQPLLDADPVSVVLVPHLDRIYAEMGRLVSVRGDDPHRWINPELHGWWVGRDFHIAIDVATGKVQDLAGFIGRFYHSYHPYYNGNDPVVHPQPAGIAITTSGGDFVGWHAIAIIRVGLDPSGRMRVYFFNPNNDSGQNWGQDIVVSTEGNGERFGEGSLSFEHFASRLYLFHDDGLPVSDDNQVDDNTVNEICRLAYESWARNKC